MESDYTIACNIVRKIFTHINLCVQGDRSKVKLNMFEKGVIKGMISEKTLKGINGYVMNMYEPEVKRLMDDIELEVSKRKK